MARTQASEAFKATSGLQTDIGVYVSSENKYPDSDEVDKTKGAIGKLASELDGKYFAPEGVTVGVDNGAINIVFDAGANSGKEMTLYPSATATGQISGWTCAGGKVTAARTTLDAAATVDTSGNPIEAKRLPSTCQ
ncbi:pilin [Cardiobacteriaceae bacterium TAE3-ERU3]|nr:pilin [Cardiobacteriaceae bacterium TAE3-ERU3]